MVELRPSGQDHQFRHGERDAYRLDSLGTGGNGRGARRMLDLPSYRCHVLVLRSVTAVRPRLDYRTSCFHGHVSASTRFEILQLEVEAPGGRRKPAVQAKLPLRPRWRAPRDCGARAIQQLQRTVAYPAPLSVPQYVRAENGPACRACFEIWLPIRRFRRPKQSAGLPPRLRSRMPRRRCSGSSRAPPWECWPGATVAAFLGLRRVRALAANLAERGRDAAATLHRSEARYRLLAENRPRHDRALRGRIARGSMSPRPARRILGYTPEELLGLDFGTFVHIDDRAAVEGAFALFCRRGGRASHTYRLRHKDGRHVWVEATWVDGSRRGWRRRSTTWWRSYATFRNARPPRSGSPSSTATIR